MGRHYLSTLFAPESVAVIGASERPDAVGTIVMRNMIDGGFRGGLYPVNPKHPSVLGVPAFPGLGAIGTPVDLAVITTPAKTVPGIIEDCGRHGVKAAIVISAGFSETGRQGAAIEQEMLSNARHYGIRVIGPNCLGVMRPDIGLNATFNLGGAAAGDLAFVSQSGALCTATLDWARESDIGFSSVVSMGTSADIDFGEILDYLASDAKTRGILLYIEGIRQARGFMSALRAAARTKPVVAIKVGRHAAGSRAAASHTGALVGADDVFDAALKRAGVVRVFSIGQLFSAAKALSTGLRAHGDRLAIVTNGGGPGVMATDRAVDLGLPLADLATTTIERLNAALPSVWSHGNPVEVIGDAGADRYRESVSACMEDAGVDGVISVLTPQAMTKPGEVADALIELAPRFSKPLLTCWMGGGQIDDSRAAFVTARIPTFRTPEAAVEAFSYIADHNRNQRLLLQTPGPLSHHDEPDVEGARMLIEGVLAERRKVLSEMESKALLSAFRIPVAQTVIARSPAEALLLAEELGFPVAMKIHSPDITHKTDAGGVRLNLGNARAVRAAYNEIVESVTKHRPGARIEGISIEPMVIKPNGRELMVGVTSDPVFGPVITFGMGGITVEILGDRAVSLPPLNRYLAGSLIGRTKVSKMLGAFRHMPPANIDALESVLLRVSEMVCELPWLIEMDINPLIVDEHGALAADARVVVDYRPVSPDRYAHMAIYPYPTHLVNSWQLPDGSDITIRPIRPEDAAIEQAFVRGLSAEAKYFRFMETLQELTPSMLARFTQIDYDREMALIAATGRGEAEEEIAVARYAINPDGDSCEFALVIADSWQHRGLGHKIMQCLMDAARARGIIRMEGDVLAGNMAMLKLAASLGFSVTPSADDPSVKRVMKKL